MRIAYFGGSFDPPHRGHLAMARAAIERLRLDVVWMAPTGSQPLKGAMTSFHDRLEMVELAVAGEPNIVTSAIDGPRDDGKPNFSFDVLSGIKARLEAGDELFFLLGADSFLTLKQWYRAPDLLFLCDFVVAGRPGFSIEDVAAALPAGVHAESVVDESAGAGVVAWQLRNDSSQQSRLYLMPDLREDVSATEVRAAVGGEQPVNSVLLPSVLRYIEEKGLYR